MIIAQDIVKALIRTEKSGLHEPDGKYLFLVGMRANKIQIKRAVEDIYKVKVKDVNTYISLGKMKRVRHKLGRAPDFKKALVTLKEGSKIDTAP
ncbi:MAG: 50S ribosomal protein L23 [Candidatus Omnitrophota bacterium]